MSTPTLRRRIQTVIQRLAAIADSLSSEGLEDEAKSLETTIADLRWQCEELDELEAASTAPTRNRPTSRRHHPVSPAQPRSPRVG